MKSLAIIVTFFVLFCSTAYSQGLSVNTGSSPDPNSVLDVSAIDRGVLIPRIDYANRPTTAIANGMLIFVTANGPEGNNAFYYYNGATWVRFYHSGEPQLSISNDTLSMGGTNFVTVGDVFPVAGFTKCGKNYYNLLTNKDHCGNCTTVCPVGRSCVNGACQ